MSLEMLENGFSQIYSIDISDALIEQMKNKYISNTNLIWEKMDCTKLNYKNDFFDFIVDKGTIDALYCSSNSKNLITMTIDESYRVLKQNCFYVIISFGDPSSRQLIMNTDKFKNITAITISNPKNEDQNNYIYVLSKI